MYKNRGQSGNSRKNGPKSGQMVQKPGPGVEKSKNRKTDLFELPFDFSPETRERERGTTRGFENGDRTRRIRIFALQTVFGAKHAVLGQKWPKNAIN